jgi:tetratricopeptide (TPR) repeat protein
VVLGYVAYQLAVVNAWYYGANQALLTAAIELHRRDHATDPRSLHLLAVTADLPAAVRTPVQGVSVHPLSVDPIYGSEGGESRQYLSALEVVASEYNAIARNQAHLLCVDGEDSPRARYVLAQCEDGESRDGLLRAVSAASRGDQAGVRALENSLGSGNEGSLYEHYWREAIMAQLPQWNPNPDDPELAFNVRALGYCNKGQFALALGLCNERSEVQPNDPNVWYYKGIAHYWLQQWEPANAAFERVLSLNPAWQRRVQPWLTGVEKARADQNGSGGGSAR